jgi:hypothetical protein
MRSYRGIYFVGQGFSLAFKISPSCFSRRYVGGIIGGFLFVFILSVKILEKNLLE